MNRVQQIFEANSNPAKFARAYLDYLSEILDRMNDAEIGALIKTVLSARERGATIFFIGNGGSAATSSHFANDVAIGSRTWDRPFRAIALTDNVAILTAIGNDYGYDKIFVLQLQTLMRPGDVVVAISASGNSPNVVEAIEWANANGATTVGLTGFDGGKLRTLANLSVHVPTAKGEYGPVEDIHMVLDHLIGAYLMNFVRVETPANA